MHPWLRMDQRRHKRQRLVYTGLDAIDISLVKAKTMRTLGKRSYLWDLSCSGGCVCTDERVAFDEGESVLLRAHDHMNADEYIFQVVIRWIDDLRFGFEFIPTGEYSWINDYLPDLSC